MQLVSIQRGTPRTEGTLTACDAMERRFTSAIWKEPLAGVAQVTSDGLVGDAVANRRYHGGADQALLAYAAGHYPRWQAEWGGAALVPGAFGENLTVDGADENDVCLGDRWAIGKVELQVTAAREPCATLARRHRVADLVKVVRHNGRGGWYLRVIREGEIAPGLGVTLIERTHPEWTVRRALRVMVSGARKERRALLECPAIASRWRERLERSDLDAIG
jgi:MOSC domain-containing protein YiiM